MSVMSRERVVIGIGAACAGCLIGFGTAIMFEQFRKKASTRSRSADRVSLELRQLRQEIRELRDALRREGYSVDDTQLPNGDLPRDHHIHAQSSSSTDFGLPRLRSVSSMSDVFFDATEDDSIIINHALPLIVEPELNLVDLCSTVDPLLDSSISRDKEVAYNLMMNYQRKYAHECTFLWRAARAAYMYSQVFTKTDPDRRKVLVFEAKDFAFAALSVNESDADVHKWCALTLGVVGEFVSVNEKIKNGFLFKEHIEHALRLKPDDQVLHYLYGRWCFEVTNLSWIERKVASTLFSDPPNSSFETALEEFIEAERLKPGWKENQLYMAKTYLALKENEKAISWLGTAGNLPTITPDDEIAQEEIEKLLMLNA